MLDEIPTDAPAGDAPPAGGADGVGQPANQPEAKPAEGEAGKAEAKPADAKPAEPPKPDPKLAEREARETATRAQLHRGRQELETGQAQLKAEREAHAKEAEGLKALREIAELGKTKPLEALRRMGFNAKAIAQALEAGEVPTDPVAAKALAETEALKKKLADRDAAEAKAKDEATTKQQEQAVRGGIGALLKAEPEKYEFTLDEGDAGIQDVQKAAYAYYEKHGKLPDMKAAAEKVEQFHREGFVRKGKLKSAAALLKPAETKPGSAKPGAAAPTGEKPTTLSNQMGTRPGGPPAKPSERPRGLVDSDQLEDEVAAVMREKAAREAATHGSK